MKEILSYKTVMLFYRSIKFKWQKRNFSLLLGYTFIKTFYGENLIYYLGIDYQMLNLVFYLNNLQICKGEPLHCRILYLFRFMCVEVGEDSLDQGVTLQPDNQAGHTLVNYTWIKCNVVV